MTDSQNATTDASAKRSATAGLLRLINGNRIRSTSLKMVSVMGFGERMRSRMDTNTDKERVIRIPITNMLEIPLAFQKAIEEYRNGESSDDVDSSVWDAKIELRQINFEHNFRRSTYECEFVVTLGKYLYRN